MFASISSTLMMKTMEQNLTFEQLPNQVRTLTLEVRELKRLLTERHDLPKSDQPEKLLTLIEAAKFLNLATSTVYGLVHRNKIPALKPSKHLYFEKAALMEYLQKGKKKSVEELEAEAASYIVTKQKK